MKPAAHLGHTLLASRRAPPSEPEFTQQQDSVAEALHQLLQTFARYRRSPRIAYGIALALFLAAVGLRFAIDAFLPAGFPFLTFFPAIVFATFIGGRGPGAVCSVLSVLAAWYWFVPPFGTFGITLQSGVAVAFFAFIAVVDVLVIDIMTRSLEHVAAAGHHARTLLEQRNALYEELQHRVANNLTMSGLRLAVLQRRLAAWPQAAEMVAGERRSFELQGRIHRALHDPESALRPWVETIAGVAQDYVASQAADVINVDVVGPLVKFAPERSANLCLLVLELITNALKHAFPEGRSGHIRIRLEHQGGSWFLLSVADDGVGMAAAGPTPAEQTGAKSHRMGKRIVHALAESLNGSLHWATAQGGQGVQVTLRFEAAEGHHP